MAVFVLDKKHQPLMPCTEKRARLLLQRGRAVVVRRHPFTLRLKDRLGGDTQALRLQLDPGSQTTGIALVRDAERVDADTGEVRHEGHVLWLGELNHRGGLIRERLEARRAFRRCRRTQNHGGSNRVSNLTLACRACNQRKGRQSLATFLNDKPALLQHIQAQAKAPLRDAAAVNITRWALFEALQAMRLPVATGSGAETKYSRQRLGIPKSHALDTACVGPLDALHDWQRPTLVINATGRGCYQRTRLNRFGFPRGYLLRQKRVKGFQTGDQVIAQVPSGKHAGTHRGRVVVRASGYFNIQSTQSVVQGISLRHCRVVQRADGYGYSIHPTVTEEARRVA